MYLELPLLYLTDSVYFILISELWRQSAQNNNKLRNTPRMALRLKKDVQKASYYSIFLGAQEARGLRGSRVLLPAIPRLVERSNEQEPLKVTLQVSHKGLKIIQVSSHEWQLI